MSQAALTGKYDLKEISEEIFYSEKEIVIVDRQKIEFLKQKALTNKRRRARLCSHKDADDPVHEMIIVHAKGNYIPPHKHINKSESFHLIEGSADIIFFDNDGNIEKVITMGDYTTGKNYYYRVPGGVYHSMIVTSDLIVFHEATKGPFNRSDTVFGPWAPDENDDKAVKVYMDQLIKRKESIGGI